MCLWPADEGKLIALICDPLKTTDWFSVHRLSSYWDTGTFCLVMMMHVRWAITKPAHNEFCVYTSTQVASIQELYWEHWTINTRTLLIPLQSSPLLFSSSPQVNIIPIIAKADTISKSELHKFKIKIMSELVSNGVQIYQFPTDDEAVSEINASMNVSHSRSLHL